MKIEIKIDPSCTEPTIVITTHQMSEEITELVHRLSEESPQMIAGFCNGEVKLLHQKEIYRIYTEEGKVIAATSSGEYYLRIRLYELESRLDKKSFVRISNSEIINLNMVKKFDLSFTGTICVLLLDGTVTYVSRRNVNKIKNVLGI